MDITDAADAFRRHGEPANNKADARGPIVSYPPNNTARQQSGWIAMRLNNDFDSLAGNAQLNITNALVEAHENHGVDLGMFGIGMPGYDKLKKIIRDHNHDIWRDPVPNLVEEIVALHQQINPPKRNMPTLPFSKTEMVTGRRGNENEGRQ